MIEEKEEKENFLMMHFYGNETFSLSNFSYFCFRIISFEHRSLLVQ